jgi:hypothetical protein
LQKVIKADNFPQNATSPTVSRQACSGKISQRRISKMSQDFSTESGESLNEEPKITIAIPINETDAADILAQLLMDAPKPDIADLDEIHLVIKREKPAVAD